jgi:glycosyltransferase involved in cell wall biosynthesis
MVSKKVSLIVISNHYLTFVKDQIECMATQFENVHVCVGSDSIAEIAGHIPIIGLKQFKSRSLLDLSEVPANVFVHRYSFPYLLFRWAKGSMGEGLYRVVDNLIRRDQIECDLIATHFLGPNGYAGVRLKEKYGIPLVVTAHGHDIYDLPFRDQKWKDLIIWTLKSADAIITVSRKNEGCIRKLGITKQVYVIPNGFRSDLFYPYDQTECRRILGLPLNKKILLTVGNLVAVKGHQYLVEGMADVIAERQDALCVIIGSGSLKEELEHHICSLRLEDCVMLVGGKPHNEIPLWMNACDLFVLPSLNEGNPTVMFEALGCGKPFVGTRVGGVPEIISDEYGLLAEPADPKGLAEQILIALDQEWDQEAILAYAERFKWENIAEEIMDVYAKVLGCAHTVNK